MTIDDAMAIMMQVDPADAAGFERLQAVLESAAQNPALNAAARAYVLEAHTQIGLFQCGEISDAEDVLIEVSRLLEIAAEAPDPANPQAVSAAPAEPVPAAPPAAIRPESRPAAPAAAPAARPHAPAAPAPESEQLPADADRDLLAEFITESREFLEGAESAMLALENTPADTEAVNRVFRAFHTIKGTSGFLGLRRTSEIAHAAESLLSRIRNNEIRFAGGYADLALRSVDIIKGLIQGVEQALSGGPMAVPEGYGELKTLLSDPEAAGISEASAAVPAPAVVPDAGPTHPEATATPAAAAAAAASKGDGKVESSVRVSTSRLDRLIDMVGELVIAQSLVAQDRTLVQDNCLDLLRKVTHAGKIVRELQDLSMSMRMIPLRATFQKMQRLGRDLAHRSGKSINMVVEDGDTEIDRHMVDIMNDFLVHMIRNAVDHGIEPPDVREAAGKDRTGTVRLLAFHSGGSVVVEIRDDGRGLDREKILKKAIATGLIEPDKSLPDGEIYNLIFAPGFSTADTITDISGRGVGMDVVRRGAETLHGRIDVATLKGQGSTFSVRLPLTLAITDGMLVRVGKDRYIIPTINIHLCFRPNPGQLSTVAGRGEMVLLRGDLMPVFRLHRLFGIPDALEDPTAGLLVVVGDGERRCTILVDELLGQQQFVAKSLGDGVGKVPGVSGGAILGDGCVGLILDPSEVAAMARQHPGEVDGGRNEGKTAA